MTATSGRAGRTRREKIVIVTRKTVLEELAARFNTVGQAKFYLEHAGQDFSSIEATHKAYHAVLDEVRALVPPDVKRQVIDRAFLPQFTFGEDDLLVTVGPDGLVVNTAKYLDGQPIVAVNPDPAKVEGVLLPFAMPDVPRVLKEAIYGVPTVRQVTMAEAVLSDGQRLLAFNDLFVGVRSHVSARYRIAHEGRAEDQSSCGILIATGAGSTGWLRSVYAGAAGIMQGVGEDAAVPSDGGRFPWDAEQLVYAVREPWPSKTTGASMVHGVITRDRPLIVTSQMAENGVIFSDGIESDYLAFTAGLSVTVGLAQKKAYLVMPG